VPGLLTLILLALASSGPHPDSVSSSRVEVRGHEAFLTLRFQIVSLLEVIPGLDADGDGEVSEEELAARSADVMGYIGDHYQLWVDTDRDMEDGTRLVPIPVFARKLTAHPSEGPGYLKGAVEVDLRFAHVEPIADLMIESTLFYETSPAHIDLVTVEWNGENTMTNALEQRAPRLRIDPAGRGAFGAFLRLGWHHIMSGWDHIAFVLALVLSARRLRSLLGVVTAFTIAHSITLALASLGAVDVARYSNLIEAVIALSIAWVAVDNLMHPHLKRSRWIEAFVFGLIHGLGFAGFLARSLVAETSKGLALFAFNVGVELGQIAIVVGLVVVLKLVPRHESEDDPFLASLFLRRVGSGCVVALGLFWFFQRI
jgi:hypothetical protein